MLTKRLWNIQASPQPHDSREANIPFQSDLKASIWTSYERYRFSNFFLFDSREADGT